MKAYLKLFPVLFLAVVMAQLYGTFHPYTLEVLNLVSKPLIMVTLMLFYYASKGFRKFDIVFYIAMLFSLLGDVLLMFQEDKPDFFMFGLGAFLIAQISYAISFAKAPEAQEVPIIKKYPLLMAIFGGYGFWVFTTLKPQLGSLQIPVMIYMIAILAMGITALNRYGKVPSKSWQYIMGGALLFIASDSILAFNKFNAEIEDAGFWIMLTYMGAQFMIVKGKTLE